MSCRLTQQDMAELAVTAIEGGIDYWCDRIEYVERDDRGEWVPMSDERRTSIGNPAYAEAELWDGDRMGVMLYTQYPEDQSEILRPLTASSIRKAFKYQPPKNRHQSKNWFPKLCRLLHEPGQYDAGDADLIVQIAVMDSVVYG